MANPNRSDMRESFLQLVRLGIGTETVSSFRIQVPNSVDWVALKALADKHGLLAVIIDGIEHLPETQRPPKDLLLQWIGEVMQSYEQRYKSYEIAIGSLAGFYNAYGFKMMVLKGYTCSLDWSKSNHRPCGDIDIWLFGKQKEADEAISSERGIKIDTSEQHHTVFYWNSFMVENHYDIIDVHHRKSSFELEKLFKQLADDESCVIKVNEEDVYVPTINLHALFLVYHTMLHFTSTEMSIRQILDWAFFVEKHGKDVNWDWLLSVLKEYHLMEFFNIVNAICVDNLGFKAEIFPTVRFIPQLKERVLNDTLFPEFTEPEPASFIKRFFFRYRRWKSHEWKHKLCYKESMTSIFMSAVWSHILKPKTI